MLRLVVRPGSEGGAVLAVFVAFTLMLVSAQLRIATDASAQETTDPQPPMAGSALAEESVAVAGEAWFETPVLPGGALTRLVVALPYTAFAGVAETGQGRFGASIDWGRRGTRRTRDNPQPEIISVAADPEVENQTVMHIRIPAPPDQSWLWPPRTSARIVVTGNVVDAAGATPERTLYNAVVPISNGPFARLVTLLVVALLYPGTAALVWLFRKRRRLRDQGLLKPTGAPDPGEFSATLDPVQLTADQWGRASVSKLQAFFFTVLVFGLLLYIQLRNGFLSGLSEDVLYLLGISAAGSVAGKFTQRLRRRLRLENWTWLRVKHWIDTEEISKRHKRAHWRDLIHDDREFDVYRFQMLAFSLIVGFALLTAGFTELAEFTIPDEMLALLGISQVVYVGGKAIEPASWSELDDKITEIRKLEKEHEELLATQGRAAAEPKLQQFREAVREAADMVEVLYEVKVPATTMEAVLAKPTSSAVGGGVEGPAQASTDRGRAGAEASDVHGGPAPAPRPT